jgi:hypothetical protein
MANVQIPNLTAAIALNGTEELEAVQASSSVRVTTAQIATYTQSQYPAPGLTSLATSAPITGGTITTTGTIGLAPSGVTNTYLASMSAGTVKANVTGSAAAPTDATVSSVLDVIGSDAGDTLYRGASSWEALQGGLSGQVLTANGVSAAPSWQTLSVPSGNIAPTGVGAGTYGSASSVAQFTVLTTGQLSAASNVAIQIPSSQVTGLGTMAVQNSNLVTISGGSITGVTLNNSAIGGSTPTTGFFTSLGASTLSVSGNTSLATVTSGTWQGSAVAVLYGGTGATTASGARANLGAAASGANSDITSLSGLTSALSAPQGGTGFTSYTTGDLLYANSATSLARLNDEAVGNALISGGVGVAPAWGKIGLTTHVSGTLAVGNGGTGATTLTGYLVGNGTSAVTAVATIPNAGLTNSSITIGSTSIALGASSLVLAGLTTVTVTQDPTTSLQLATKQYVDNTVSTVSNTTYHLAVTSATTAALTATYSNGTGGVGATLTNAGAQAAFSIDTYSPTATSRVLIKDQASALQNGIYTVTTVGTGSTNWVLTRSTDFDEPGTGPDFIQTGAAVYVSNGTTNGATSWLMNTTGTISVGSTALNWTQISSAGNIQVDAPIIKTGNVLSLGTVTVANGGTGLTSYTAYSLLYAPTTSSVGGIAPGTVNYPLVSTGASSAPAYQQLSLTAGVTGILPVANGGTGTNAAFTLGSVVFAGASGNYAQDNAEFFYDATNGYLGLGTTAPTTRLVILSPTQSTTPSGSLPAGTDIYIVGANNAQARITQDSYGTGVYPAYTGRGARGTAASPTASQTDDDLSQFTGRGYGASAFGSNSTGILAFHAAENFTNTAQGTYASILLAATGATTAVERWRFGPAGQLGIGGATYGTSGYVLTSGGASAAPTWSQISLTTGVTGVLPVANGGTNLSSYTTGDLVYASGATTLAGLADVATGNALISGGVGAAPSYGKIGLETHVSGTLPVGSGGTGTTTLTGYVKGNGTSAFTAVASIPNTDITGLGTMSTQDASSVTITGGTINGTTIGATTRGTGAFTTLAANSTSTFTGGEGTVGIGSVLSTAALNVAPVTVSSGATGVRVVQTIASTTTGNYRGVGAIPSTSAASFSVSTIQNYYSGFSSLGASSSVGTIYGYLADSTLSIAAATATYGFYGNLASAAGTFNFYAGGNANNAFNGSTRFGSTTAPTATVDITGTLAVSSTVSGAGFTTYFASPPPIGSTAANTGAFTTLSASSTVSGTGFSTYLASPPAIGGTAAAAGSFTTLSASSTVSGTGFSTYLASPPAIGGTTAAAGSFTTLSASSTVSGTGFSTYLASPPAIGGTAAAAGSFTTLTASTSITVSGVTVPTISSTSTLTNKRVTPRATTSGTTSGNQTPTGDSSDQYIMTGLTGAITMLAPSGSPTDGQKLILRFLDNGTARGITWTTSAGGYRALGTTLPTTTVANKTIYVGCIYNSTSVFWDVVSVAQQA